MTLLDNNHVLIFSICVKQDDIIVKCDPQTSRLYYIYLETKSRNEEKKDHKHSRESVTHTKKKKI